MMGRLSPRLFWLGSVSSFMGLLSLLCLAVVPATEAQYIQDWDLQPTANGGNTLWWRPNINSNAGPVHYFDNNAVFLTYNCYYMTAICRNARNFLNSPRGLARPYPNMFSYDFGQCRTSNHRRASCLSSWAIYNPCPATGQPTVHRQDGPWFFTDLDPVQTPRNVIRHLRDTQGNIVSPSYLRYTCDEFPAPTWVEGGTFYRPDPARLGFQILQGAETTCAAYRCPGTRGMKIYGEQNWQARAQPC